MTENNALIDVYTKINDNYTVTMCENGFVVEVSGERGGESWVTTKYVVSTLEEFKNFVQDLAWMPRT